MILLIIIYLLGFSICFILNYRYIWNENGQVTLGDLAYCLFVSVFSWLGTIICILVLYNDVVIVRKRTKIKNKK